MKHSEKYSYIYNSILAEIINVKKRTFNFSLKNKYNIVIEKFQKIENSPKKEPKNREKLLSSQYSNTKKNKDKELLLNLNLNDEAKISKIKEKLDIIKRSVSLTKNQEKKLKIIFHSYVTEEDSQEKQKLKQDIINRINKIKEKNQSKSSLRKESNESNNGQNSLIKTDEMITISP